MAKLVDFRHTGVPWNKPEVRPVLVQTENVPLYMLPALKTCKNNVVWDVILSHIEIVIVYFKINYNSKRPEISYMYSYWPEIHHLFTVFKQKYTILLDKPLSRHEITSSSGLLGYTCLKDWLYLFILISDRIFGCRTTKDDVWMSNFSN